MNAQSPPPQSPLLVPRASAAVFSEPPPTPAPLRTLLGSLAEALLCCGRVETRQRPPPHCVVMADADPERRAVQALLAGAKPACLFNNMQTEYARRAGTATRTITVDRLLPVSRLHRACQACCVRALAPLEREFYVVTYSAARSLAEDHVYVPENASLAAAFDEFRATSDAMTGLRVGYVVGRADRGLVLRDAVFVSQKHYDDLAELHVQAMHDREVRTHRRPNCVECTFSPATILLRAYSAGTSVPVASIASVDLPDVQAYKDAWDDPWLVRTSLTRQCGFRASVLAILWFFGGVRDPLSCFVVAIGRLAIHPTSVVRALEFAHDSILADYNHLLDRPDLAAQRQAIARSTMQDERKLYSCVQQRVIESLDY